jgi:hypothetical protein
MDITYIIYGAIAIGLTLLAVLIDRGRGEQKE